MSQVVASLFDRRILLVEDEYLIVEAMEKWLTQAGAVVIGPVPNVKLALGLIDSEGNSLDAAVLDVNLGRGETIYPVADRLTELGVPYLFATADVEILGNPAHQQRPCLTKPVSRASLLKGVEEVLRLPRIR